MGPPSNLNLPKVTRTQLQHQPPNYQIDQPEVSAVCRHPAEFEPFLGWRAVHRSPALEMQARLTTERTDGTWSPLLSAGVAKLLATIIYSVKKWQSKEIRRSVLAARD